MKKSDLKILGVVGDPVAHSLSPLMQNAALAHEGLPYLYKAFHVAPAELENFIKRARHEKIFGLNITIPHKQAVITLAHSVSREARLIGAVNTLTFKKGKIAGYNTDAMGYARSLEIEAGYDVEGKQVILLGAGGAARAIGVALGLKKAREVLIANRTAKKAHDLAAELHKKFPGTIFGASGLENFDRDYWAGTDLIINSSSMGMKGSKILPLPFEVLPSHALISDIVYNPLETPLLSLARKHKLARHPGWGMLLHQGALSFELWTGRNAPLDVMRKTLINVLKNK